MKKETPSLADAAGPFPAARFIKEIGRGKKGARSMSREDARTLYAAMLDRRVSDLELGGILLAMRIKGESSEEIAGFLDAAEIAFERLAQTPGDYAPIVIPSYNGSRQMPNLTPLLALLLAREGAPVLMHGVTRDPARVTSAEVLRELQIPFAETVDQAAERFAAKQPAFMPIQALAPKLAQLLALRPVLGVRNSTHTLVKILQPFEGPAVRLVSYTHPEYLETLGGYFTDLMPHERGTVLLMRGTEGETVANAKRAQQVECFQAGQRSTLIERQAPVDESPALPAADAKSTALWIGEALRGEHPIPAPIAEQVAQCLEASKKLRAGSKQE